MCKSIFNQRAATCASPPPRVILADLSLSLSLSSLSLSLSLSALSLYLCLFSSQGGQISAGTQGGPSVTCTRKTSDVVCCENAVKDSAGHMRSAVTAVTAMGPPGAPA